MDREAALIERIRGIFAAHGVLAEPHDSDAAVLPTLAQGRQRVVTTDVAVEGVDFDRTFMRARDAGHRALVQNLSDLAAVGATPIGFVWALSLPPSWGLDEIEDLAEGAARVAATYRCPLLRGDLSSTSGPLQIAITVLGDVVGAPCGRTGARVGDVVWVSHKTGAAARGLRLLQHGQGLQSSDTPAADARAIAAFLQPVPSLQFGARLHGIASSSMDVSDGLLLDLSRLARASKVAFDLPGLDDAIDDAAGATADDAQAGGEDWALVFTTPQAQVAHVPAGAIRLGSVVEGAGLWRGGAALAPRGYVHATVRSDDAASR